METKAEMNQRIYVQTEDETEFVQSIMEHQDTLISIAYSYLRNRQDALEAVQEMTCRAWIKRRTLNNEKAFKSWIIRILIYVCIDEQRRRKRATPLAKEDLEDSIPASWMISVDDNRIAMESLLQKVKPKYRHVLLLKYYNDMTLTDIASILGKPEGTVTSGIYQFTVNAVMADENRITVLYTARTDASQEIYSTVNMKMTDASTGYLLDNGNAGGMHFSKDKHTIYGRKTIELNRNKPLPEQVNLQFQLSSFVPDVVENLEKGEKERKYKYSKKMNISFALDPKFSIPKTEIINVNRTFTVGGYEVMLSEVEVSPLVTRVRLVYEPDHEIDYKTKLLISEVVRPIEIVTTSKDGKQTNLSTIFGSGTEDGMMYSFSSNLLDHPESMVLKLSGKPDKVYDDLQEAKNDELGIKIK